MKHIQYSLVTVAVVTLALGACAPSTTPVKARPSQGNGPSGAATQAQNQTVAQVKMTQDDQGNHSSANILIGGKPDQAMFLCESNVESSANASQNNIIVAAGTKLLVRNNMQSTTANPNANAAAGQATTPANAPVMKTQARNTVIKPPFSQISCPGSAATLKSDSDVTIINLDSTNSAKTTISESVKADFVNTTTQANLTVACVQASDSATINQIFGSAQSTTDMILASGGQMLVNNASTDSSATKYILITCDDSLNTDGSAASTTGNGVTPSDLSDTANGNGKQAQPAAPAAAPAQPAAAAAAPAAAAQPAAPAAGAQQPAAAPAAPAAAAQPAPQQPAAPAAAAAQPAAQPAAAAAPAAAAQAAAPAPAN